MNYPEFSFKTRETSLNELRSGVASKVFDALIVGGGIVGAGLARELAIRGISSLLVEKSDYASGTSSRSSKLIHGGLRYLEMYDFHLVFESLAERHWLLNTHPHLVQPLEFNLPLYDKKLAPAGARGGAVLGIGLWLYDALSLFRTPFFHGKHSVEEMKALFPNIRSTGLKGGYYYADAMMLDDELVLETILDAHRRGAKALNYTKVLEVSERGSDKLYSVKLEDSRNPGQSFTVKAKEVIACVGPWTEKFGEHVVKGAGRKLKPSKGVHLILPLHRFPVDRCLVMYSPDGRIIFAIPRKDLGTGVEMVIIGTTDSPEHGDLDDIHANSNDIDYLLKVVTEYFPEAKISRSDIVMTYAGVRPLLDTGEESEAKTSREHEIWKNDAGIVFMAGGKYTTFRKISQELADFAFPKSHSAKTQSESKSQLSDPEDYKQRLTGTPIWGRFTDNWIRWKIEHHAPCTLEDIVFRRVPIWMGGKEVLKGDYIDRIAEIARPYFKWTDAQLATEKQNAVKAIQNALKWEQ